MNKALLERPAAWLSGDGQEAAFVLACRGSLVRNFADLPFPLRCSEEERRTAEERVLRGLEAAGLLGKGQYWRHSELEAREVRFIAEQHLLPEELMPRREGCGVYVGDDQGVAILVNGRDHLRMVTMMPGLQPNDVWPRLNALDDALSTVLDFAFDETYGYQTAAFDEVGTGFRLTAFVHLPALTLLNRQIGLEQHMREQQHVLAGAFGAVSEGLGDLYALSNQATLGRSEEEVSYHVHHAASDLIGWERKARETLLHEGLRGMEDRVGRAQGAARGARLLGFEEAVALLSSLRLGVSMGTLDEFSYECLNDLLVGCQQGHLEVRAGQDCDELALNVERADLFRARLS